MSEELRPKVGVGVIILRGNKLLLGKRKGKSDYAAGHFSSTGGHVENLESLESAVLREIAEENGLKVKNLRFLCVVNLKAYAPKHYIDIGFIAEWAGGEPELLEPDRYESWGWYDLDDLPDGLFATIPMYLEALKTGRTFFDA